MDRYSELLRTMREKVPVGESFDLLERKLVIGGRDASMFFVDGLVDGGMMQRVIFRRPMRSSSSHLICRSSMPWS